MNGLQTLNYQEDTVRMIEQDGETWWVLSDVCRVLEIVNHKNVAARLDEDEKGVCLMDTLGGKQSMTTINESGLYSVILKSNKPEAKAFKRWITHEVLPAIRRNGTYSMGRESAIEELSERVARLEQAAYTRRAKLSTTAQALWHTLVRLEHDQQSGGQVQISSVQLAQQMNVRSVNTLRNARYELMDAGYIMFFPGAKGNPGVYQLNVIGGQVQND